ncbi:Tetraspanin-1 [Liparis tanakae]|uniref:Tetraspanin-1 n=1 Tax=Liparis tanakae TaxID=230148 RepID=A0A4Z2J1H9_9TELE|nr:Tetraspanin-1 [Liparis tanakae]
MPPSCGCCIVDKRRGKTNAKMCCSGFLKIMMFIFNGGIFLAGACILGVGVWVKVDSGSLLGLLGNVEESSGLSQLVNAAYLLIGVGAVLLVIGFLGCCGAVRESRCMLLMFFSIVLIIFLIEVAAAVVLLVFQGVVQKVLEVLEDEVKTSIKENYGNNTEFTKVWNATMEQEIDPCFIRLVDLMKENAVIIGAVALGIAALEVAAMVVSMVLYKNIGNKA